MIEILDNPDCPIPAFPKMEKDGINLRNIGGDGGFLQGRTIVDSSAVRRDGGCRAAVNTRPLNLDAAVGKTARPEGLKSDIKENRKRGGKGGAE